MKAKDVSYLSIQASRGTDRPLSLSFCVTINGSMVNGSAEMTDAEVERLLGPILAYVADRFAALVK